MNIHTQQTDCEAEIAAGARGPGDTLQELVGRAAIHLYEMRRPLQPRALTVARTGLDRSNQKDRPNKKKRCD